MPCYHPITAWRVPGGVSFRPRPDCQDIKLSCGQCIGCRLQRSVEWAIRLVDENRFHTESSFITLTYDQKHLPKDGSLDLKHFQHFMKRLRKELYPKQIRFFHAGEYGERFGRPHYHAIIFGHGFFDGHSHKTTDRGDKTWSSFTLDKLWSKGMNTVGAVTFESCAYVARYCIKKVNGKRAAAHYERICEATGEIFVLKPEYCTMSRRPGIGFKHFMKHSQTIYRSDSVLSRGVPCRPPRFYDKQLEKQDFWEYERIKSDRECALMMSDKSNRTRDRLAVREAVKLAQIGHLTRDYEHG